MADKEILGEGVIIDAPTGAQHGVAVAAQIISRAQPRSKVIEVARIQAGGPARLSHQLQRIRGGIEQAEAVAIFIDHAKIIPAQAGIDGELVAEAEIILHIKAGVVLVRGALRVAGKLAAAVGDVAGKKIFKGKKLQPAAIAEIVKLVDRGAAILIAKLQIVLAGVVARDW